MSHEAPIRMSTVASPTTIRLTDANRTPIDLSPISLLLKRIHDVYHPEQIWLFGSRARGDARPWSDWDLLVVIPDNGDESLLDPLRAFRLQKGAGVYADVIPCPLSEFQDSRDIVNTICYAAATEGILLYER